MKKEGNIYTIYLRQPDNILDERTDPIYRMGCFGSTGCHSRNVLHPDKVDEFNIGKDRLCFMQGGSENTKILFITTPITEISGLDEGIDDRLIIKWDPRWGRMINRPLKYEYGLKLTTPFARRLNENVKKNKPEEELYQNFRSISESVDDPNYLMGRYGRYLSNLILKRREANEAFITHNHETFEYKNEPNYYVEDYISWCSSGCPDEDCLRKINATYKVKERPKSRCRPKPPKSRRC